MKIQVLHGMIASGKSTYARKAAKAGAIVVNDDSIVNALHADDYSLYNEGLKLLYKSTENHIIQMALAMGRVAIVDRGLNVSHHGRKRWVAMAHSLDVACDVVVFPKEAEEVHARRRLVSDSRGMDYSVWLEAAKRHGAEYSEPELAEGWDNIHHVTWDEVVGGRLIL